MDLKKVKAPVSTETYDRNIIDKSTDNIYEAISIISKRSEQINSDIRTELIDKLEEFATYNDSLEEIFENREQIEISKFYERMPKPTTTATEEFLNDEVIFRRRDEDDAEGIKL